MKKKVALLLALVMVLATLPMHVFGAVVNPDPSVFTPVPFGQPSGRIANLITEQGATETVDITIPIARLTGGTTARFIPNTGLAPSTALPGITAPVAASNYFRYPIVGHTVWARFDAAPLQDGLLIPVLDTNDITSGSAIRLERQIALAHSNPPGFAGVWHAGMAEWHIQWFPASQVDSIVDGVVTLVNGALPAQVPGGATGYITFPQDITAINAPTWQDAWIGIWLGTPEAGSVDRPLAQNTIFTGPLATSHDFAITISAGWGHDVAPRDFSSALLVPPIVLRESRGGAIHNAGSVARDPYTEGTPTLIRLVAPQFYTWSLDGGFTGNVLNPVTVLNSPDGLPLGAGRPGYSLPFRIVTERGLISSGDTATAGNQRKEERTPFDGIQRGLLNGMPNVTVTHSWIDGAPAAAGSRHVLWIEIPVNNRRHQAIPDALILENLWLVPDDRAQNVMDVNINVQRGWGNIVPAQLGAYQYGWQEAYGFPVRDGDGNIVTRFGQPQVRTGVEVVWETVNWVNATTPGTAFYQRIEAAENTAAIRTQLTALGVAFGMTAGNTGAANWENLPSALVDELEPVLGFRPQNMTGSTQGHAFVVSAGGLPIPASAESATFRRVPRPGGEPNQMAEITAGATPVGPAPGFPLDQRVWGWTFRIGGTFDRALAVNWSPRGDNQQLPVPSRVETVLTAGWQVDLLVGRRGATGLSVNVIDGPREVRTGYLGGRMTGNPPVAVESGNQGHRNLHMLSSGTGDGWQHYNRDNVRAPHYRGVMTSSIVIEENLPNSFGHGHGNPINFDFLDADGNAHPGIRVLGIQARAGNDAPSWGRPQGTFDNFPAYPGGVRMIGQNLVWELEGRHQNWMSFMGFQSAITGAYPNVPGVGRVHPTGASIYLPGQNIIDVRQAGTLEVRFFLSVEAGYEWKYGEDINVTITGNGVTNLFDGNDRSYTTTIALARDPISLNLVDGATEVEVGSLYNIGRTSVSDIEIEVNDLGAFGIGAELWLYVATGNMARNRDIQIESARVSVVNTAESGLRLDQTRRLHHPQPNYWLDGLAYTVTRQPYGGSAPNPIIRIEDVVLTGQVFPDVNYYIVVSGTQIAQNDQEVRAAVLTQTGDYIGAGFSPMHVGTFTALPYHEVVVEHGDGGVEDLIGAPGGATGERLSFADGVSVNVDGEYIVGMRLMEIPGTGFHTALFNPRVFADFVGAEIQYANGVATFSGINWLGVETTIQLTRGSTDLVVNGVTTDIAAAANQPQLAGRVAPATVDARFFVPVRALANLWGVPVEWTGRTVVLG